MKLWFLTLLFSTILSHFKHQENIQMIKPSAFKSRFRYVQLQNNLEAMVISSESSTCGAHLTVSAGSNQELYDKYQGLAHLLEHILYNGDPSSNEKLSDILQRFNGDSNAVTNDQRSFEQAIKIWSKAFNQAKFSVNDIEREIHAVNSEFVNAQSEEQWHFQEQVRKSSNPQNPFFRFNMGNTETLPNNELDQLYQEAKRFYQKNYVPEKMHLMLVCNESLDKLSSLVDKYFGNFSQGEEQKQAGQIQTFQEEHLGKFIWLHSAKNKNLLTLIFPIPKEFQKKIKKSTPYDKSNIFLKKLLESPNQKNFLDTLYKNNWILDFNGGSQWHEPEDNSLYQIKFLLTDAGIKNAMNIIKQFFKYIHDIEGQIKNQALKNYHTQLSLLTYLDFYYSGTPSTEDFLNDYSNWYTLEDKSQMLIEEHDVMLDYNEENLNAFLKYISPQNAIFALQANKFSFDRKIFRFKEINLQDDEFEYLGDVPELDLDQVIRSKMNQAKLLVNKNPTLPLIEDLSNFFILDDKKFIFAKLEKYNSILNYYYQEASIPANMKKEFNFQRFSSNQGPINIEPLKYLTKNLDVVSNCKQMDVQAYQLTRDIKSSIQEQLIMPSPFTSYINTMLESRSQKRYDSSCFNNEVNYENQIFKSVLDTDMNKIKVMSQRGSMVPKTKAQIQVFSPLMTDYNNYMKFKVLMIMFLDSIQLELLKISESHNKIKVKNLRDSLNIGFHGFSDQIEPVLHFVISEMKSSHYINENSLQAAKMYVEIASNVLESLEQQSTLLFKDIMKKEFKSKSQGNLIVDKLTVAEMIKFQEEIFESAIILQYFSGNILENQALNLGNKMFKLFNVKKQADSKKLYQEQLIKLPVGQNIIFRDFNQLQEDKNNSILNLYQIVSSDPNKEKAILIYLDNLIQTQSFNYLREQMNLGYIVQAQAGEQNGVLNLMIYVQGFKYDPNVLDKHIEDFIKYFYDYILSIGKQKPSLRFKSIPQILQKNHHGSFLSHKQKVINEFEKKLKKEQDDNQFDELIHKDNKPFIKRNNSQVMSYLMNLSAEDVSRFWLEQMIEMQRKLSIQIYSQQSFSQIPTETNQREQKNKPLLFIKTFDYNNFQTFD